MRTGGVGRFLAAMLCICFTSGCAFQTGISNKGFAVLTTVGDVRVGWKSSTAADVNLEANKDPVSEEGRKLMAEAVKRAVQVGLACAGIGAASAIVESCPIPLPDSATEVLPDE